MKIRALLLPLAAAISCAPLSAADVGIQGPVLGYYTDPAAGGLHAIAGVPGSATVGPALASDLDSIWVGPDSRTALGARQGMIFLLRDVRDTTARVPLMQWTGSVESVTWSNDSSGALIYSSERRIFQTATGLAGTPVVNREIDLTGLGDGIFSFRLSGNPWNVAASVRAAASLSRRPASRRPMASAGSLYLFTNSASPVLVRGILRPGAMDFTSDATGLYVADEIANHLLKVSVSMPETTGVVALSPELVPADFIDLAVSPEGKRIFILDKKRMEVCGFEIASGSATFCSGLDFSPSGMKRLAGSLYLFAPVSDPTAPLWVLDSDLGRTFFVPLGSQR